MIKENRLFLLKIILAFASIYIIWGSTYVAIVVAMQSIPPFLMLGIRFFIAGLILFLWCVIKKYPMLSFNLWLRNSFAGILMLYCGTGAVAWVEQYIPSGLTAILVAIAPFWYVILDKRLWHFHFTNKKIIAGLLVGLVGVILLFSDKKTFDFSGEKMAISIIVLMTGNILWVSGSLFTKYNIKGGSPIVNSALQMLAAGTALILTGLIIGEQHQLVLQNVTWQATAALLYLIIFGSLAGYLSFVWLLTVRPPSVVGTHALINPVVAVFLGWLLAGEQIQLIQVIGLIIILSGVVLVNFSKVKKAKQV